MTGGYASHDSLARDHRDARILDSPDNLHAETRTGLIEHVGVERTHGPGTQRERRGRDFDGRNVRRARGGVFLA